MNNEFKRMRKLAGILSEGYTDTKRADNADDLGKSGEEHLFGAGVKRGEEFEKKKMSKMEAKKMIKDAVLAEMSHSNDDYGMREEGLVEASGEAMDRMQGLVSVSTIRSFVDAAGRIIRHFKEDGFEEEDIYDFLMDKVKTLSIDESLDEAKKKKKAEKDKEADEKSEEDIDVDTDMEDVKMDIPADDVAIDMDMNDTPDMSVDSTDARATFDDLAKAYQAAKGLGDEKLIQQLANTITYFNKNIILK
jgi:hypothetical protein